MERRDLILDEIEKLSKVLSKILSSFFNLKSSGNIENAIEITNKTLSTQLEINIDLLFTNSCTSIKNYVYNRRLTQQHLEFLINYLTEIGIFYMENNKKSALSTFESVLCLININNEISNSVSFESLDSEKRLNELISKLITHGK